MFPSAPLEILLPTLDWKPDTRRPICSLPSVHSPWRPPCQRQPSSDCSLLNGQAWCPHQVHHCDGLDTCLAGLRARKHEDPSLAEKSCLPASWSGAREFQVSSALPGLSIPITLNLCLPESRGRFVPSSTHDLSPDRGRGLQPQFLDCKMGIREEAIKMSSWKIKSHTERWGEKQLLQFRLAVCRQGPRGAGLSPTGPPRALAAPLPASPCPASRPAL